MSSLSIDTLNQAFLTHKAIVGVMGLGYVGLPLVKALGDQGFHVIGFDVDETRVKTLKEGTSYIKSFPQDCLENLLKEKRSALITMAVTGKIDVRSYEIRNAQEPLQV